MMEEEGDIVLFERFQNGELSDSERMEFEARLSYDAEFNQAFQEYKSVEDGIKTHYRNELKLKLQEVDKKMDDAPKKSSTIRLVMWSSSVAAAIAIGVFIFQHYSISDNKQLVAEYWPYEEGLPVKMSTKGKYDDAMNAFKLEEFDKAETLLKTIDSDTSTYFLGVIAYNKQNTKRASVYFSKVDEQSIYYHEAQFRLALIAIIHNDIDKAKQIFKAQIEEKTEFEKQAKEILEKI